MNATSRIKMETFSWDRYDDLFMDDTHEDTLQFDLELDKHACCLCGKSHKNNECTCVEQCTVCKEIEPATYYDRYLKTSVETHITRNDSPVCVACVRQ